MSAKFPRGGAGPFLARSLSGLGQRLSEYVHRSDVYKTIADINDVAKMILTLARLTYVIHIIQSFHYNFYVRYS